MTIRIDVKNSSFSCPECGGLPTFRTGCPNCGSSRIKPDLLVHHYACGNVDFLHNFLIDRQRGSLTCPKCHKDQLIVNCDYDVSHGLQRCHDCGWTGNAAKVIGDCIKCKTTFLLDEAVLNLPQVYFLECDQDMLVS